MITSFQWFAQRSPFVASKRRPFGGPVHARPDVSHLTKNYDSVGACLNSKLLHLQEHLLSSRNGLRHITCVLNSLLSFGPSMEGCKPSMAWRSVAKQCYPCSQILRQSRRARPVQMPREMEHHSICSARLP